MLMHYGSFYWPKWTNTVFLIWYIYMINRTFSNTAEIAIIVYRFLTFHHDSFQGRFEIPRSVFICKLFDFWVITVQSFYFYFKKGKKKNCFKAFQMHYAQRFCFPVTNFCFVIEKIIFIDTLFEKYNACLCSVI